MHMAPALYNATHRLLSRPLLRNAPDTFPSGASVSVNAALSSAGTLRVSAELQLPCYETHAGLPQRPNPLLPFPCAPLLLPATRVPLCASPRNQSLASFGHPCPPHPNLITYFPHAPSPPPLPSQRVPARTTQWMPPGILVFWSFPGPPPFSSLALLFDSQLPALHSQLPAPLMSAAPPRTAAGLPFARLSGLASVSKRDFWQIVLPGRGVWGPNRLCPPHGWMGRRLCWVPVCVVVAREPRGAMRAAPTGRRQHFAPRPHGLRPDGTPFAACAVTVLMTGPRMLATLVEI